MPGERTGAWVCLVCGYVHRGPEPPDACPVCGSPCDQFEPYAETPPAETPNATQQWRCLICGHVHEGNAPPDTCPVCSAKRGEFEAVEKAERALSSGRNDKIIVIGAGIAGVSAVESVRAASPGADVTLISKERELPYYRLNLTRFLAGEISEDALPVHSQTWYSEQRVRLLRGVEVKTILPDDQAVQLDDGSTQPYDKLVITCGAHPFIPPIPGAYREGVAAFRTIEDARSLINKAKSGVKCVCIGGGILGLETASGLAKRGAAVTLIEDYKWLLPRQLNQEAGEILERHVAALGIIVLREAKSAEIIGDEHARGVLLADGTVLPADLVIVATGVRPNSYLARAAGLKVNGGIVVDGRLTTSHPNILAAGDVAEYAGNLYGQWEPARYQGAIAGMNAVGVDTEFGGMPRAATLKVLGIDLFSVGVIEPPDGSYDVFSAETDGRYYRFMFHDSRLVGAILIGGSHIAAAAQKAVKTGSDFSKLLSTKPAATNIVDHLAGTTR